MVSFRWGFIGTCTDILIEVCEDSARNIIPGNRFRGRQWNKTGVDCDKHVVKFLQPSQEVGSVWLSITESSSFTFVHPTFTETTTGKEALVSFQSLTRLQPEIVSPSSLSNPNSEQQKWENVAVVLLEILTQNSRQFEVEDLPLQDLTEKVQKIQRWTEDFRHNLVTFNEFDADNFRNKLSVIYSYLIRLKETPVTELSTGRSAMIDGISLASSCILYYIKMQLISYWGLISEFFTFFLDQCVNSRLIDNVEISQQLESPKLMHLTEKQAFFRELSWFIFCKEKHEKKAMNLLKNILDQQICPLDEQQRRFCEEMQATLSKLLEWRHCIQKKYSGSIDFMSTLCVSLSLSEKLLGLRFAADIEIIVNSNLKATKYSDHLQKIHTACLRLGKLEWVSCLCVEFYDINVNGKMFILAKIGTNCSSWLGMACSEEILGCIECAESSRAHTSISKRKLLCSTLGSFLEMGLDGHREKLRKNSNHKRAINNLLFTIEKEMDALISLKQIESTAQDSNSQAILIGMVVHSKYLDRTVLKSINWKDDELLSCLNQPVAGSQLKKSSTGFELSKVLHSASSLWSVTVDTIIVDDPIEMDKAQASLDIFDSFPIELRNVIQSQYAIDRFENDILSGPFNCLLGRIKDGAKDICPCADPDLADFEYADLGGRDELDNPDDTEDHLYHPEDTEEQRLPKRRRRKLQSLVLPNPSQREKLMLPYQSESYYRLCQETCLLRQIQVDACQDQNFVTVSVIIPCFFVEKWARGVPMYLIVAQRTKGLDSEAIFFSSCQCNHCSSLREDTIAHQFFGKTLVLKKCTVICPSVSFVIDVVIPQAVHEQTSEDDLVPDITVNDEFCSFESKAMNHCQSTKIIEIAPFSIDKEMDPRKKSIVYSVLQFEHGTCEHSFVRQGKVQTQRLKDKCNAEHKSYLQLHCMACNKRLKRYSGRSCVHCHKVEIYLKAGEKDALSIEQESEVPTEQESDQSGEQDDSQNFTEDKETFVESFETTGYQMLPTLTTIQGHRCEFDIDFNQSEEMRNVLKRQSIWLQDEFRSDDSGGLYKVPDGIQKFEAPQNCCFCNSERGSICVNTRKAKVYMPRGEILMIDAEYWQCCSCDKENCFDGRDHHIWFHTAYTGIHEAILFKFLREFVNGIQTSFSSFVEQMNDLVQTAMHGAKEACFVSEPVFSTTVFSMGSTFIDFRLPCLPCAGKHPGVGFPAKFTGTAISEWRKTFLPACWDSPALIQDALSRMVQSNSYRGKDPEYCQIDQKSNIFDRSPIPTGGFENGKFLRARNATSRQRRNAIDLRKMLKAFGEEVIEICNMRLFQAPFPQIRTCKDLNDVLKSEVDLLRPLICVLHEQNFPASWNAIQVQRFAYSCGSVFLCLAAEASVLTLMSPGVVSGILDFCDSVEKFYVSCNESSIDHPGSPGMNVGHEYYLEHLLEIEKKRTAVLSSIAPNTETIPADVSMHELSTFISFDTTNIPDHKAVNIAICSVIKYIALRVCQVLSLQGLIIPGCEGTGIFDDPGSKREPARVRQLQTFYGADQQEDYFWNDGLEPCDDLLTHNPLYGHVSYFTREGNQLRKVPILEKDKAKAVTQKKRDPSDIECHKHSFIADAKQGRVGETDSLFVTSCALHRSPASGGYHLIKGGAEGRIDAYQFIQGYKPSPPALLIYDFACG